MAVASAKFWDRAAEKYSRQPISDEQTYARKLTETQALMHPGMHVLELGCGTGSTALAHAGHVQSIDAVDISSEMVAIAQDKAGQAGIGNVRFHVGTAESFDPGETRYDMVLMLNLLHLVEDRKAALDRVWQLLAPGGYFISSTACLADRMSFLRAVIPVLQLLGKAPYVSFMKADQVRREIAQAGFVPESDWTHGQMNALFMVARKPGAGS